MMCAQYQLNIKQKLMSVQRNFKNHKNTPQLRTAIQGRFKSKKGVKSFETSVVYRNLLAKKKVHKRTIWGWGWGKSSNLSPLIRLKQQ